MSIWAGKAQDPVDLMQAKWTQRLPMGKDSIPAVEKGSKENPGAGVGLNGRFKISVLHLCLSRNGNFNDIIGAFRAELIALS